jgi:hypothetical protein
MAPERSRQVILIVVLVTLGVVTYRAWPRPSVVATPTSNGRAAGQTSGDPEMTGAAQAPTVHLPALAAERPKPATVERNLFRFKAKPTRLPSLPGPTMVQTGPGFAGSAPPQLPPITLKFIGVVERGGQMPKIAVLSDAAGHVFYGTEGGDPIEGRYRILRIGTESIELAYLDGSGRRTIRLTGS